MYYDTSAPRCFGEPLGELAVALPLRHQHRQCYEAVEFCLNRFKTAPMPPQPRHSMILHCAKSLAISSIGGVGAAGGLTTWVPVGPTSSPETSVWVARLSAMRQRGQRPLSAPGATVAPQREQA